MPLFRKGETCPLCGQRKVETDPQAGWFCANCQANGPTLPNGHHLNIGLRGHPQQEWEAYHLAVPLAVQLKDVIPGIEQLVASPDLSVRLDDAVLRWFLALTGTTFDIEDAELEAAEATNARNLIGDPSARADEARFYTITAASTGGWQWRVAEEGEEEPSPSEAALMWTERYRESGQTSSRSEVVGMTAGAVAEDAALDANSPGGPEYGHFFISAGWALEHAALLHPAPQFAKLHPLEILQRSFRFGVALRDAQVAYDLSS